MGRDLPEPRPRPSYEEGEPRDPKIVEKQSPSYSGEDLKRLIRKAAPKRKTS